MTKQAEGAAAGYKVLLTDHESVKKQTEKLQKLLGGDDDDDDDDDQKKKTKIEAVTKLMQENTELDEQVHVLREKLENAHGQVAVVTKQAESQSSAFMKLMDEKKELDKQVETIKVQEEKVKRQRTEITKLTEERDSLKAQIQDYDFMFAEAKKKAE